METPQYFTITKILGVFDSTYGKKVNFKTNETGEKQISCFTKFPDNMKEGGKIYGHIELSGEYHSFKWDKDPNGGRRDSMSNEQYQKVFQEVYATRVSLQQLVQRLEDVGVLKAIEKTIPGTSVKYPESSSGTAFDEDPASDPEWDPFAGMETK